MGDSQARSHGREGHQAQVALTQAGPAVRVEPEAGPALAEVGAWRVHTPVMAAAVVRLAFVHIWVGTRGGGLTASTHPGCPRTPCWPWGPHVPGPRPKTLLLRPCQQPSPTPSPTPARQRGGKVGPVPHTWRVEQVPNRWGRPDQCEEQRSGKTLPRAGGPRGDQAAQVPGCEAEPGGTRLPRRLGGGPRPRLTQKQ